MIEIILWVAGGLFFLAGAMICFTAWLRCSTTTARCAGTSSIAAIANGGRAGPRLGPPALLLAAPAVA